MDRRDFLKVGGAAAVTAGAGTAPARAAPAILSDAIELRLASPDRIEVPGADPDRLARRIELATGGRYRIVTTADAHAELAFGDAGRHVSRHKAFGYFAGLPMQSGMAAETLQTWLAVGGGQMLWDDLGAQFGFKPLAAGHTGPSAGLWSCEPIREVADLFDARLQVTGLAADVLLAVEATPVAVARDDLRPALAERRIDGVEWLGAAVLMPGGPQPLADHLCHPGLTSFGSVLSLDVRKDVWDGLSATDQAIFEACASEAYQLSLAETRAQLILERQIGTAGAWPSPRPLPHAVVSALNEATQAVLRAVAESDGAGRRIHDSCTAFRSMLDEARTV
jgi:TRAP-type mannitol/chloroaromatic compound transport system substrate-binding protein